MSIICNDSEKINCYKFTDSNKISKTTLQNLENQDNKNLALVEMNFFGINQVYSLINVELVKSWVNYLKDILTEDMILSITRIMGDSPVYEGVNLKTRQIVLDELSITDWILIYQLYYALRGMSSIADTDIEYDLQIGKNLDNPDIDFGKLCFTPQNTFKYILRYGDSYEFANQITNNDFTGIFINIPEFNCWQYLSKSKFENLINVSNIEIRYAVTDSPRCFSRVAYSHMYSLNDMENIIRYSIYIPIDIYFRKIFDDANGSINHKTYDAIEIVSEHAEYTTSVLLTHDELGIDSFTNKPESKVLYMDKFWLLKLINNVICLKPY